MLKVELHTHTSDDPEDWIPHSAHALIDRAAALGYDALAITLHDHQFDVRPLAAYAAERGIVLIPGMERTIEGRHVLLLNFPAAAVDGVRSFEDLAALKQQFRGLVVAPHPFFPMPSCLLGKMDQHADVFDAVEYNAMYTGWMNFNRAGRALGAPPRQADGGQRRRPSPRAARHDVFAGGRPAHALRRSARRSPPGACAW